MLTEIKITEKIDYKSLAKDIQEIRVEYPKVYKEINTALEIAKKIIKNNLFRDEIGLLRSHVSKLPFNSHNYLKQIDNNQEIQDKKLSPQENDEFFSLSNLLKIEEDRFIHVMKSINNRFDDIHINVTMAFIGITKDVTLHLFEEGCFYFPYYILKIINEKKQEEISNDIGIEYSKIFGEKIAPIAQKIYDAYYHFPQKDYLAIISFVCRKKGYFFNSTIADHIIIMGKIISIFSSEKPFIFYSQYEYMMFIIKYKKMYQSSQNFNDFYISSYQEDPHMPLSIKAGIIRSALLLQLSTYK